MEIRPTDYQAIDNIYGAIQKAEFSRLEGSEVLGIAQSLGRLIDLKARLKAEEQRLAAPPKPLGSPVKGKAGEDKK